MNGDWSHEQSSEESSDTPKYIGGAFMAAGVVLAGWVVNVIYHLITGEGPTDIVSSLIPKEAMDVFIQTPGGPMEIPPSSFYVFGLMVTVMLLWICAGLARTFITTGMKFFLPGSDEALKKIQQELQKVNRR